MEVLPPLAQFPLSPALFTERRNTATLPSILSLPASSSRTPDFSSRLTKNSLPTSFLPLPTIIASPVCSPDPSFRSLSAYFQPPQVESAAGSCQDTTPTKNDKRPRDETPPNSQLSLRVLFAAPTWISTPPTPPHKYTQSHDSWRPSSPVSPSASLPASTSPRALPDRPIIRLKRCLSDPAMSPHSQATSTLTLTSGKSCLSETLTCKTNPGHRSQHSKPVFHLPKDADDCSSTEYAPSVVEISPVESCEGHQSTIDVCTREVKDAMRISHSLQELLSTETDYVKDLRVLLVAYIQRLASFEVRTSAFARASASFSAGPWANTYTGQTLSPTDGVVPSTSSTSMRQVFSESEINVITRNLREILRIHEDFLSALRRIMTSFGVPNSLGKDGSLRSEPEFFLSLASALEAISKKFIAEAPKFEAYQALCAGHPEAMSLIKRVASQHPAEWEVFEQHCWSAVAKLDALGESYHIFDLSRNRSRNCLLDVSSSEKMRRRRTMSTVTSVSKLATQSAKDAERPADSKQPRLLFTDYLIKPVQRICKYPLLLRQLMPRSPCIEPGDATVAIRDAIQVMRDVASSVDEARRKREAMTKSSLIISRFVLPPPSPSLNQNSPVSSASPLLVLTPAFLLSLGPCLLSGSLDVMYHTPRQSFGQLQTITAKYLGIFLYSGGYLILSKVLKGKRYEPRHWFSLANFEITGADSDEAMLPCSFRLSTKAIHFELAAACQREKDIWLEAISDSRLHESTWCNEPLPSFKVVRKDMRVECLAPDMAHPILGSSDAELSASTIRRRKLTLRKSDITAFQDMSRLPNRRSSTASIKSIFAPMGYDPNSICINRSLISGRLQIDHELQDVASQVCLSARLQARLHDEVLFPQPLQQHGERSNFSRSSSAISVAGLARNRLSKQESLRVPRRKPRCDSMTTLEASQPPEVPPLPLSVRRSEKRLSLQALPTQRVSASSTSPTSCSAPFTAPVWPSVSASPLSRASSPLSLNHRSSNSFVRTVRGLFIRSGQMSPQSPTQLRSDDLKVDQPSPLLRRLTLRKGLRRKARRVALDEERYIRR